MTPSTNDHPSPARILIVDDEAPNRKLMQGLVTWLGQEPLLATGGGEALALLEKEPADLVLLDLMMPEIDGLTVLERLHEKRLLPDLPVIVVTALDDHKTHLEALSRGAMDFLTKPVNRHELACRVKNLLRMKRAQDALKLRQEELEIAVSRRTEQYQALLQTAPDLIFLLSPEGTVHYLNRSPQGYDVPPVGATIFDFVSPSDREQTREMILRSAESEEVLEFTLETQPVAGNTRGYQARVRRLSSHYADQPRILLFATDVTERRELEQSLAQKQKMEALGQLAGGVAHDFNNLLTAIMSHSSFLLDSLPAGDERRTDAEGILQSAERAAGLTRQLLAFSRRQPVKLYPLDLNQSVKGMKSLLERTLGGGVALKLTISESPSVVLADPIQMDQVLLNLAVNARDAMPQGGTLSITVHRISSESSDQEAWIELSVTDTGVGMEESVRRRIFQPFFTTKAPGKGTGLGLATCYGIVQQLSGEIQVKSRLGQGTTFTIVLPSYPEESPPVGDSPEVRASRAPSGATILLVEDEEGIRETSRRVLESADYQVMVAEDGTAAADLIKKHAKQLDLVLSDIVLPEGSGFEVVNLAAELAPEAALLLMSGYVDHWPEIEPKRPEGWPEILPKPYSNQELLEGVGRTLATAKRAPSPSPNPENHPILVVDDDPAIRSLLQRALTRKGYPVTTAEGVTEARNAVTNGSTFSAVLCDQNLGDGLGTDFIQWLADHHDPHLAQKALLLSGEELDQGNGCHHFLRNRMLGKPFKISELVSRLDRLLC